MSSESLLPVICGYPHHALLSNHILLLILWRPEAKGETPTQPIQPIQPIQQIQQEKFDQNFFDHVVGQVSEKSAPLGQAFNQRLKIYRLEAGSLAPHQAYFRAIALALVSLLYTQEGGAQAVARAAVLEEFLCYLEDEGLTDTSRSCPIELVHLLTRLAGQGSFKSLYDPNCATGRLLTGLASNADTDLAWYLSGFGQSSSESDIFHAQLRAVSKGDGFSFETTDALRFPPATNGELRQFDIVVSDLSNGVDAWPQEIGEADPFWRFRFGLPSRTKGEFVLVQQMLATMRAPGGVAMVIVDQSVLLRSGKDAEIRQALIESNLLDAVIFLPQKLFRSDARSPVVLVFKASRTDADVLMINGSTDYESSKSLNKLTVAGIQKISEHFASRTPVANEALLISIEEFRHHDYAVGLSRYFPAQRETSDLDLHSLSQSRGAIENELFETSRAIDSLINALATRC